MSDGRFAILDPAAGISGDMLLGALIAAGAPRDWLIGLPDRLGVPEVQVSIDPVDRSGVRAVKVSVRLPDGAEELPAEVVTAHEHHAHGHQHDHAHAHGHEHHHHGPHRHVGELVAMVERAPLSVWVRERAVRAFQLIGEAEGRVHGMAPDRVMLHEVGALDALVDIVGAIEGFERLGITTVFARPVAMGQGWVRAAHGTMSVPTPATAELLAGLDIGPNGPVEGEATTPTGAALLRVLTSGPPPARWRPVGAGGWGAGGRNPSGYANVLRLTLAEPAAEAGEVVMLATDLDDLSPEYVEPLRRELFAAGAVDVVLWGTQMKKGRPAFRIEALVPPGAVEAVTTAFFRHSTTAGVRRWTAERVTLARREMAVETAAGQSVRVKILEAPGGLRAKPEYDDVAAVAEQTGRPVHEVARDLQSLALRLANAQDVPEPRNTNQESEE